MKWIKIFFLFFFGLVACSEPYKEGKATYMVHCAGCHGNEAEGFSTLYPDLKDAVWINQNRNQLANILKNGTKGNLRPGITNRLQNIEMPPNTIINEIDITNILNYLNYNYWKMDEFSLEEIKGRIH
ncbi:MAG: cytochrome c [Bacteroidota bacterium]|nr:cytochrome c [Bacteroidota bacterium]